MAAILVIDDEPKVRAFLRAALEGQQHTVREAEGGGKGVALYREQPADLVFCDMCMPDQDGLTTLCELRRDEPAVKVVCMSASGAGLLGDALVCGAVRVLAKPIRLTTLLRTVDEVLTEREALTAESASGPG